MTTYADIDTFAEQLGERRRRAEAAAPPILHALGLPAQAAPGECPGEQTDGAQGSALSAPVRATAQLLTSALSDLGDAEEELRVQNEALFAAQTELEAEQRAVLDLFDLAPVAYAVTTRHGSLVRVNHEVYGLLGWPINLTVGKPLAVFVAPDDRASFRAALWRPLESGRVESWRVRLLSRDGEELECRVRVRATRPATTFPVGEPVVPDPLLYWVITPELSDPADDLV